MGSPEPPNVQESPDNVGKIAHKQSFNIESNEQMCPLKQRKANREVPWWNKSLEDLRTITRRHFNTAKGISNWGENKISLTNYNKELGSPKRNLGGVCVRA